MYVAEGHEEHHVVDKTYYESPMRLSAIVSVLTRAGVVSAQPVVHFGDSHLRVVHRRGYLDFLVTPAYARRARQLVFY